MRTGIYRVAHTINKKTNLYKIPISIKELFDTDINMHELAKDARIGYAYSERVGSGEFVKHVVNEAPRIQQAKKTTEPLDVVPCVQKMLNIGPQEGNRNQTLMRIASHCSRHGIPSEFAKAMALHWNNNSLEKNEVIEKVEYVYNRGYRYGCQDSIMAAHCQTRCIHFKRKDYLIDVKNAAELQEDLKSRLTTDFSGRTIDMGKALGLDIDCEIYPGELVTIFGPTGSGKTTFAHNLVLGVDFAHDRIDLSNQIPCLYLSLELSAWYMHRRSLQIVSGLDKEQVTDNFEEVYELHKDKVNHVVMQTIAPNLDQIQQKVKELSPAVVVVDYIDLINTNGRYLGEYEQIKQVSHYLSNLAVNMDIIIIQISQVSRDYSRNEALDLYAGKGSGAIENASRKVIGLNGQANSNEKSVHLYKNTDGELFDTELVWQPSFRLRRNV
jgi:archaellum biogenesis ATPase FlaH